MEKPYYKENEIEEDNRKEAEANQALQEILGDPFKDPMEDMIDNLIAMADETQEAKANATMMAAIAAEQKEKDAKAAAAKKAQPQKKVTPAAKPIPKKPDVLKPA